jgi:hypothetical protein
MTKRKIEPALLVEGADIHPPAAAGDGCTEAGDG